MERFSDKIKKAILKFFMLVVPIFLEVVIEKEVMENICEFAKNMHPKEFIAVIEGEVNDKKLIINNLYYREFASSVNTASFTSFMGGQVNGIGTVHSHPSSSIRPSNADLNFFAKRGGVHFIIGYPYNDEMIAGYDYNGNEINFRII